MLACYVVNTNSEDSSGKKKCAPMLEDYYECLHHRKEVSPPPPEDLTRMDTKRLIHPGRPRARPAIRIPQAPRRKPQRRRPYRRPNKESRSARRLARREGHQARRSAAHRQDQQLERKKEEEAIAVYSPTCFNSCHIFLPDSTSSRLPAELPVSVDSEECRVAFCVHPSAVHHLHHVDSFVRILRALR